MNKSADSNADRIRTLRKEYRIDEALSEESVSTDPIAQFRAWFETAINAGLSEPNAMTLATCGKDDQPSARIVLLKDFSPEGFTFFTNYSSRKGEQLAENNRAALLFFWSELERQVRIEGEIEKVSRDESARYFASRPRGSQLGAVASCQSRVISSRLELEKRHAELTSSFEGQQIACPEDWGGYRLKPVQLEFWQGRENRLHDRIRYRVVGDLWKIERLSS